MNIILNGETTTITDQATVTQMLADKGYANMLVAVAINGSFVPKSQHNDTKINADDRVDIVAPMQGG